jgi:hypothetical protein
LYNYLKLPEHMRHATQLYVEHGILPGHFLTAVLSNDLKKAVGHADEINVQFLSEWVIWLYNEVPSACWGSPERVEEWVSTGGLKGGNS